MTPSCRSRPAPHAQALLALALLAAVLPACRSSRPPPPPAPERVEPVARSVHLVLTGASGMNRGNAAVVRVYALRGASALTQTSLEALWTDDAAALGPDLVRREEVRLYPGASQRLEMEVGPETTHVAVVANLRAAAGQEWWHVFRVDELWGEGGRVIIGADRVGVSGE